MNVKPTTFRPWAGVSAVLLAAAALQPAGCARYHDYEAFLRQPRPIVTGTTYRMAPPDVVAVTSKRVREVNGHREAIRPDGMITLPLLGQLFVAGRTPEEVGQELQEKARQYYDDADVSLRVVEYRSKKIYVFGEVTTPGAYPYNGANSVLGTLATAQPSRLADPGRIQVLRPNADGELIRRMTINLNKMVKKGDTSKDAVLEDGDIIYVPANALAAVGLAFQQILLPIQPAAATFKGPADIDNSVNSGPYRSSEAGGGY